MANHPFRPMMLHTKTRTGACLTGQRFSLCNVSLNLGRGDSQSAPELIMVAGKPAPGAPPCGTQTSAQWRVVVAARDARIRVILVTSAF